MGQDRGPGRAASLLARGCPRAPRIAQEQVGAGNPGSHGGQGFPSVSQASTGRGQDEASRPWMSSSPARTSVGSGEADGLGRSR